jgi:glycerol-3-phosphate acyltransferase PlsX
MKVRVAVDAMGGDYGPRVIIDGALAAARHLDVGLVIVGQTSVVHSELARHSDLDGLDLTILEAPDVIEMAESPSAALRRKPGASVKIAAGAVARG